MLETVTAAEPLVRVPARETTLPRDSTVGADALPLMVREAPPRVRVVPCAESGKLP